MINDKHIALLRQYLKLTDSLTYDDGTIENIRTAGEWVMFEEVSECRNFRMCHQVTLFDIVVVGWSGSEWGSETE